VLPFSFGYGWCQICVPEFQNSPLFSGTDKNSPAARYVSPADPAWKDFDMFGKSIASLRQTMLYQFVAFYNRLINLMEAIPLCDIIEVYTNIYLRLYTTILHNSNYNFYLVRGDLLLLNVWRLSS